MGIFKSFVNTLAPHQIAEVLGNNIKFIQLSTGCVFLVLKGTILKDYPDAKDLYGKSKALGEPSTETSLTVKLTIGYEINANMGY